MVKRSITTRKRTVHIYSLKAVNKHFNMDSKTIGIDFNEIKTQKILFKTNLHSYLFDAEIDESKIVPEDFLGNWIRLFGINLQHITEIKTLEKTNLSINNATQELISLYKSGKIEEARNQIPNLELKIDNLLLLLQIIELKFQTEASALKTKQNQQHTEEEFIELSKTLKNLDVLYKEQTEALSESRDSAQKKLENYFSQAPIGICILKGKNFLVELANDLYLQLVTKNKDFINKPLFESLPELKGQEIENILKSVYNSGIPYIGSELGVYLVRNGEKQLTHFNFIYQPLRDENGNISGIIVVCNEVSGIVMAQKEILEKQKEFKNIVSQSPIAIAILKGKDFIIEIGNNAMLKLWRKDFEEVVGKSILDVFPELRDQAYAGLLKNVMQTGIPYRDTESLAHVDSHDGRKTFYLDFEYSPLFNINNEVYGIMCTVNNVTDRVKARKLKDISQKRQSHLIQTLPVAMYTINKKGYIDLYNKAAETLWGRKPELEKDRWCGAYKLSTLDGIPISHDSCPMAMAFQEGRSLEEQIYMHRENGEKRHVIVHPQPLYNDSGKIIGASKVMIDITDSKEAEEALRKSEEKFRLLASSIPQFIWTSDPEGNLDYFSDSVFKYTGMTPAEIANGGWLDVVHPEEREENIKKWFHSVNTGEEFKFEHRFRRHDGVYHWQLTRAIPQKDSKGNIQQWVGTSTDIEDHKTFQKKLENLVNERTKELKKANIELENMNKELSSFAYISSHDLQEPLRKIQTFGSIIQQNDFENLSDNGKRNFARMQLAANRMKTLINDLLTYSRTNSSEKVYEKTDLNLLLNEMYSEFSETLEEKNGKLEISKMPEISAIPFQLRQLFLNLISNALKFTRPEISPVIRITSKIIKGNKIGNENIFQDQQYLHIMVADNGIGFSQEYATKIFEVFQRLHGKGEYEGTGIGLAICSKIAENHNAIIKATSEVNNGATFHLYFPVVQ